MTLRAEPAQLRNQLQELRDKLATALKERGRAERRADHWRQRHDLAVAAHADRDRELRGHLAGLRGELEVSQQETAHLQAQLGEVRDQHAAQVAEVREATAATVADERARLERLEAELVADHDRHLAALAETPAALRVTAAEQARRQAEAKLEEVTARLEGRLARQADEMARLRRGLGSHLAVTRGELAAAKAEATDLRGGLDQARGRVAELEEKLAPRVPEKTVKVRWTRDSPAEGCQIAGRVYRGRGPRIIRRPVRAGFHSVQLEEPGEVVAMPEGAAVVLSRAGYVVLLGAARNLPHETHARTASELLNQAMWMASQAQDLAQADEADRALAEQVRAQLVTQYKALESSEQVTVHR